jgi:hypothetical protein
VITQQQGESWHVLYEGAFPRRALLERGKCVTASPSLTGSPAAALEDRGIAVDGVFSIVRSNG